MENKFENNIITSQTNHTPPYEWSDGIFQKYKPISGNFPIGNSNCGNNTTGRAFYANPCGYWEQGNTQFNSGKVLQNTHMVGALFPTNNITNMNNVMVPPNDRVVYGHSRIGENYRSR